MTPPTLEQALELSVHSARTRQDAEAVFESVAMLTRSVTDLAHAVQSVEWSHTNTLRHLHAWGNKIALLMTMVAELAIDAHGIDEALINDCRGAE